MDSVAWNRMRRHLFDIAVARPEILIMPDRHRGVVFDRIRAYLGSSTETASGEFAVPMLTGVLRVRRL